MTLDFAKSPDPHADKVVSGLRVPDFDMRPTGQPLATSTSNAAAFGGGVASPPAGPSRSLDYGSGASSPQTVGLPRR
jgi:hypothetical protein